LLSDEEVARKVSGISKLKGLSIMTIAVLLAETNGFELFTNFRQLVSYSGYDVVEHQSGKHRGRTTDRSAFPLFYKDFKS
ncbi:MAG: transposase, partial [Xanthomarina gelatinilytica]|uniref:transposase n=1 Tax=Xanthomarina gelatinilytica TaxID=1137281 RepID=UPI003A8375CC